MPAVGATAAEASVSGVSPHNARAELWPPPNADWTAAKMARWCASVVSSMACGNQAKCRAVRHAESGAPAMRMRTITASCWREKIQKKGEKQLGFPIACIHTPWHFNPFAHDELE
jgi:hypothetical protein